MEFIENNHQTFEAETSNQKLKNNKINIRSCQTEYTFNFILLMYFNTQRDVLYQELITVVWKQIDHDDIRG